MHDVFVVTCQNWDGGRITRVIYAANRDDARRTHRDNYPDESIAAMATRYAQLMSITASSSGLARDLGQEVDGELSAQSNEKESIA